MDTLIAPQVVSLVHPSGLSLDLMDLGATWLSCRVPLDDGSCREVILGCAMPADYRHQHAYLGAMIGRYANRIANASLSRNGRHFRLHTEAGAQHQLHGGPNGFDRRMWSVVGKSPTYVNLRLVSGDGDQGFPGRVDVELSVSLSGPIQITVDISATTTEACPVCITHHPYFNLDANHTDVRAHRLQVAADRFLPVDQMKIPLGELVAVDAQEFGAAFDFRVAKPFSQHWLQDSQQKITDGYDHAFLLNEVTKDAQSRAALLYSEDGRLSMSLSTSLPALHVYAGQGLEGIISRDGSRYAACAGVALEPEFLPDSPSHPEWPQRSCWLQAGATYQHVIRYDFEALSDLGQCRAAWHRHAQQLSPER